MASSPARGFLNENKWIPKHPYWNDREPIDPANVSVRDGMLPLRSTTGVATLDAVKNPEKEVWVQTACVTRSLHTGRFEGHLGYGIFTVLESMRPLRALTCPTDGVPCATKTNSKSSYMPITSRRACMNLSGSQTLMSSENPSLVGR